MVADGMRLGKTLEALATAYLSQSASDMGRWIAIVPAAKKWDWADEAAASLPGKYGRDVDILSGRTPHEPATSTWLFVLNYEIVEAWGPTLLLACDGRPGGVILDESVYVKGRRSKRFNATLALCDAAGQVLALSGEPVENRPSDLWGQLRCLRGKKDFGTFSQFHRRYCGGVINEWGGYDYSVSTNEAELRERLYAFTIRRTKFDKEVARTLPPTTRQLVSVEGGEHVAAKAAAETAVTAARGGERTIVFAYHRDAAATAASEVGLALRAVGLEGRVPVTVLTGGDPAEVRAREVRRVQASTGPYVLVATIDSVGLGQELSSFDVVAFTELHYVPTRILQAEERLYAVGRRRPVGIYYCVVRGSEDERVAQLVIEKLGQIERVLGSDAAAAGLTRALGGGVGGAGGAGGVRELSDLVRRLRDIERAA